MKIPRSVSLGKKPKPSYSTWLRLEFPLKIRWGFFKGTGLKSSATQMRVDTPHSIAIRHQLPLVSGMTRQKYRLRSVKMNISIPKDEWCRMKWGALFLSSLMNFRVGFRSWGYSSGVYHLQTFGVRHFTSLCM
jgi:hypothetical protein